MSSQSSALLSVSGLEVCYGAQAALRGIEFELLRGEILAIVGESGSGKSTLALALLGLLPAQAHSIRGEVILAGRRLVAAQPRAWSELRGRELSYVAQDPRAAFDPLLAVGQQVAEPLVAHGAPRSEALAKARKLFDEVGLGHDPGLFEALPHRLSGGECQRAALAAALALDPKILIADEPTSALDPVRARALIDLLEALRRSRGLALLWISHDLRAVAARADRVLVLQAGRVVESGSARGVLEQPRHAHTRELVGALARSPARREPRPPEDPLLRVHGLGLTVHRRGSFERARAREFALADVEFELRPGEITAVIGESGSGKSTLLRALLALEGAASGSVHVALSARAIDVLAAHGAELSRARRALGWIPQDPGAALDPRATLETSVAELLDLSAASHEERRSEAGGLLEDCGLAREFGSRLPHELSGGERQRGTLARALAQSPSVLLLDEPTSNLDASVAARIVEGICALVERERMCALWVTHDVDLARACAQRVLVIDAGRIVESGATEDVLSRPKSPAAQRLVRAADWCQTPDRPTFLH
ncbi:MAG TPA: ABC transporter ATP-binding protein [Planctomycetota bacterium]|nr:ABC transporter ATP-binding protein [Planctomycetota bacterium]